jgi:flagellar basal body-associated protein FliL
MATNDRKEDKTIFRVVILLVVGMVLSAALSSGVSFLLYYHGQQNYHSVQQQSQSQAAKVEHALCLTLDRLAANKPPAGNPIGNPSRAYEQAQHAILAQLSPDLECK